MSHPLRILGLDTSSKTGFAHSLDPLYWSGTKRFQWDAEQTTGSKLAGYSRWLDQLWVQFAVSNLHKKDEHWCPWDYDMIVYEQPHLRGAGSYLLTAFTALVQTYAGFEGIPCHSVHTATLKKFATGDGRASKEDMMKAAETTWPGIKLQSDDHADALWVMEYGRLNFRDLLGLEM